MPDKRREMRKIARLPRTLLSTKLFIPDQYRMCKGVGYFFETDRVVGKGIVDFRLAIFDFRDDGAGARP
jgi:hypothetical protein